MDASKDEPYDRFTREVLSLPAYEELLNKYAKRKRDTVMDSVTAGLSYADNVAVDFGLLEESGLIDSLTIAAPFAVIAVTEQAKVILGKKTGKAGFSDAVQRMVRTGAAMGVGALAGLAGGPVAAIPASITTRALLARYKSKTLLGLRVQERTGRLKALREKRRPLPESRPALMPGVDYLPEK